MAKLKGIEVQLEGSCETNMAEKTSIPTRDGSKEHKSDLTIENGAPVSHKEFHFQPPYTSKISRPRSPSSHAPPEEMSKRPAININGNSYQFNNSYVSNQEINGSKLSTLHQIPCASNSHVIPQTLQITEKPNMYLSNGNFLSNQFNNPYQHNKFPAPTQINNSPFIHIPNNIPSYNWENSVPFRPSFNWSKFDFSSQSQSQTLYDPLVHSIDPPPIILPDNDKKSDSESMKISPQISEQEEEAESNNISLPPSTKPNNNNSNNNIISNNNKFYYGSLGADETNEVSSSNSLSLKPGQTGLFNKRESKELKQFKIALAEYIKELLRPAWQKGILSKEAHKRVVKKSVEKVAGSVKSNQIPDCEESTKQYLSMYKPKIEKLLQEYLEIYGKSEQRDLEMEVNSVV